MKTILNKRYYQIKDLAKELDQSYNTLIRLARIGHIPTVVIGKQKYLIEESTFKELIKIPE